MSNSEIIKSIESSNSRIFKENIILEQMNKQNDIFFKGLSLAYNKLLTLGLNNYQSLIKMVEVLTGMNLINYVKKLIKRELTGHAARDEIINLKK